MNARSLIVAALLSLAFPGLVAPQAGPSPGGKLKEQIAAIRQHVERDYPRLEAFYKHLHANPELSLQEEQTAAGLARELREAGFDVTEKVGGHGVVAVLKNGQGPTVLVRADMDALPIEERTGLPYASKVRARDKEGKDVGVMHACGHDINVTCLVGAARVLAGMKERWRGTLVFIGQPAEEIGAGARAMLADGLLTRFPRPDVGLALHCDGRYAHGHVNYRDGQLQANVDSVDITVRGKGGHGAAPHAAVDPVVLAARIVLDLQTIVSREIDPTDPVVVTVGSIHGGSRPNIIPSEVKLQVTVRTMKDATRKQVLEAIARKVRAAAEEARAPEPVIAVDLGAFTPALINDAALTKRLTTLFRDVLGGDSVHERPMSLGGEDFSQIGRAGVPTFYYFLGVAPPQRVAEASRPGGRPLITVHMDQFAPVPEPTIQTGVLTMVAAVLELAGK